MATDFAASRPQGGRRPARATRHPRRADVVLRPRPGVDAADASAATRRKSCGCCRRSSSAAARSRSSAAPSASSRSCRSSPAPRSACRATRRSSSSVSARSSASSRPSSTPARSRRSSPGLALSATVGCGFTAQLGAMRISEEIDALEVMAVPEPAVPGHHPDHRRLHRGRAAVRDRPAVVVLRVQRDRDRLLPPVIRHVRPLLPPVPAAGRRPLVASSRCWSSRSSSS